MLVVPLLAVSLAAGCGGDSGSSGSTSTAEWADGLCSAITTWTSAISSATNSLKGTPTADGLKSAAGDVESATETFVDDVKGLGKPDTEAGQKAKESLDKLADNVNEEAGKIKDAADGASGASGVLAAASTLSTTLATIGQQLASTFQELEQLDAKGELESAFKDAEACKPLQNSGS